MTYLTVWVYDDKNKADVQEHALKRNGKTIKRKEVNKYTSVDKTENPVHRESGNPLYLVLEEG